MFGLMKSKNFFLFLICILFVSNTFVYSEETLSERYTVKPLVSLIVSGENSAHALEVLQKAKNLSKKVKIVNILLVASTEKTAKIASSLTSSLDGEVDELNPIKASSEELAFKEIFDSLRLTNSEISVQSPVFLRLRLSYSPTWIVRYQGKDYVYEGFQDISNYFSSDGNFTR